MIAEKTKQNANYFRIVTILRSLLNSGEISKNEYTRAKAYYKKLPVQTWSLPGKEYKKNSIRKKVADAACRIMKAAYFSKR